MALKNFLDFFLTENSEEEINSLISGFEDLGINEKPKVWFLSTEGYGDGYIKELLGVEASTEIQAMKILLDKYSIDYEEDDKGNIINDMGDIIENFDDERFSYLYQNYFEGVNVSINFVKEIDHPYPNRFKPEVIEYEIYRQYDGISDAFKSINKTNAELKRKYGIGLEDLRG